MIIDIISVLSFIIALIGLPTVLYNIQNRIVRDTNIEEAETLEDKIKLIRKYEKQHIIKGTLENVLICIVTYIFATAFIKLCNNTITTYSLVNFMLDLVMILIQCIVQLILNYKINRKKSDSLIIKEVAQYKMEQNSIKTNE